MAHRAHVVFFLLLLLISTPPGSSGSAPKKKKRRRRKSAPKGDDFSLVSYTSIGLQMGVGPAGEPTELEIRLPPASKYVAIASPAALMKQVTHVWDQVVAPHQAGLSDPRAGPVSSQLSAGEAWHHWEAGKQGVVDSARFLVAFGVVPSLQQGGGSRLHAAAARGLLSEMRGCLEADDGRAVHATAEDGTTALHAAAATGHAAAVTLLLDAGADPQATGRNGATPLHLAAAMGHAAAVAALLRGGATLVDAAHAFAHCTALHFAAEMGHVGVVRLLCAAGADANAPKTTGGTPLHTAADCDQPLVVGALLDAPCAGDASRLLNGDTSALYLAAQRGFTRTVEALIDGGADPNFVMPRGVVGTHLTVAGGAREPMGAGGFYPQRNTEVGNGATALHAAVENGHRAAARLLLARGARQIPSMEVCADGEDRSNPIRPSKPP